MSGTTSYESISDVDRRALLAMSAVYDALAPVLDEVGVESVRDRRSRGFVDAIHEAVESAASVAQSDSQIVELVAGALRRFLAALDETGPGTARIDSVYRGSPDTAAGLFSRVTQLLGDICADDPIDRLFSNLGDLAADAYASQIGRDGWRAPILEVVWVNDHPRSKPDAIDLPDPYALTTSTFRDAAGERAPIVTLEVFIDGFGLEAYCALPSMLTHEWVCHVPARQSGSSNSSPFAEGFMDWAARFFFDRWIGMVDPALAPAARIHAELLRQATGSLNNGRRRLGHSAADTLLAELQSDYGYEVSVQLVARLAVELNSVTSPLAIKDAFTAQMNCPRLSRPGVLGTVRAWCEGRVSARRVLEVASGNI